MKSRRIGIFDIETSSLFGDLGMLLSWCILDNDGGEIIHSVFDPTRDSNACDHRLVEEGVSTLRNFDHILGFYSSRFDMPFFRTRALINGIDFSLINVIGHTDCYYILKDRLKLKSYSQSNLCAVLLNQGCHPNKFPFDPKIWQSASTGNLKSLEYILEHNKADVTDLQLLWHKIEHLGFAIY